MSIFINRNFEIYDQDIQLTIKISVGEDGLIDIVQIFEGKKEARLTMGREMGKNFAQALSEFCAIDDNFI